MSSHGHHPLSSDALPASLSAATRRRNTRPEEKTTNGGPLTTHTYFDLKRESEARAARLASSSNGIDAFIGDRGQKEDDGMTTPRSGVGIEARNGTVRDKGNGSTNINHSSNPGGILSQEAILATQWHTLSPNSIESMLSTIPSLIQTIQTLSAALEDLRFSMRPTITYADESDQDMNENSEEHGTQEVDLVDPVSDSFSTFRV